MKFKDWVPKTLVDYYHAERLDIEASINGSEPLSEKSRTELRKQLEKEKNDETALLLKLATNDDMNLVWRELCKRSKRCKRLEHSYRNNPETCTEFMIYELISSIQLAIVQSQQNHPKRQDDIEKYYAIAKAARELIRVLTHSSLNTTVYQWYPANVITSIIQKDINPEKLSGLASYIYDKGGLYGFRKGDLFREYIKDDGRDVYEEIPKELFFDEFIITGRRPVISEIW